MLNKYKPGQDRWEPSIVASLDPRFAEKLSLVFDKLLEEGVVLRPYSGFRGPLEQAILWCQSRTALEVSLIVKRLQEEQAPYLAKVLQRALMICQPGRWATNNLPGQSWHNFGLAVDAHVVSEDGRAVWGPKHPAYSRYAELVREAGLFPGYDLARQDVVHVQALAGPVRTFKGPWRQVSFELERLYPADAG